MPSLVTTGSGTLDPLEHITFQSLSTTELAKQPWLPEVRYLINEAYEHIHSLAHPMLIKPGHLRLRSSTQLMDELGPDGRFFVALAPRWNAEEGEDKVTPENRDQMIPISCAGIKPLQGSGRKIFNQVKGQESTSNGVAAPKDDVKGTTMGEHASRTVSERRLSEWELCTVCSLPQSKFAGKGITSKVLQILERYVSDLATQQARKVTLVICNIDELTGKFWPKKGFKKISEVTMPIGHWDAVREFQLNWGVREIEASA